MHYRMLFLIVSLIIWDTCFASEPIKLAVENSWPPYSDVNGNGISKDIIQKAFDSVNVKVEFIVLPYARALHMVEIGQVDGAFNVTKQESTIKNFNFGEEAILQAAASFYYSKDSEMDVLSANDIPTGSSVAVIIGYEYGNIYEQNKTRFKEVRVSNQKQIIQLILNKRVDLGIIFDEVANFTLTEMSLKADAIKKGHINHKSEIFVAFNKKENTKSIIKLFDQGLRNVKTSSQ